MKSEEFSRTAVRKGSVFPRETLSLVLIELDPGIDTTQLVGPIHVQIQILIDMYALIIKMCKHIHSDLGKVDVKVTSF